jgi:hypothetical protein
VSKRSEVPREVAASSQRVEASNMGSVLRMGLLSCPLCTGSMKVPYEVGGGRIGALRGRVFIPLRRLSIAIGTCFRHPM